MKTLYIVRHAKSSRDDRSLKDWERPLNDAGIERAFRVSKLLKQKNILPEKMISSHAKRAYDTALIFAKNLEYPVNAISVSKNIYEKDTSELAEFVHDLNDTFSSVMIFGHNPGFTDLYNYFSGENIHLSTSAVACVEFDVEKWNEATKGKGKTKFIETGK